MIEKEKDSLQLSDKFQQAGYEAEKQMAFYLRRAFADSTDFFVYNDLRIERNGEIAQIDHLVLHRFGLVIVESKSVTGTIEVNAKCEFVRVYNGQRRGMQSPVQQAKLQSDLLRALLNDNKTSLRRKVMWGTVQGEFSEERFRQFVAISDGGEIRRSEVDVPELAKADAIVKKIQDASLIYRSTVGISGALSYLLASKEKGDQLLEHRVIPFETSEIEDIRRFLLASHRPLPAASSKTQAVSASTPPPIKPLEGSIPIPVSHIGVETAVARNTCKHCGSENLDILYGKYGYYFKCFACSGSSNITASCPRCSKRTKLRKKGSEFTSNCEACGSSTNFHTNPVRSQ